VEVVRVPLFTEMEVSEVVEPTLPAKVVLAVINALPAPSRVPLKLPPLRVKF
jgi:hypothetical protein